MNTWSSLDLSLGLFSRAFESFRDLRTPELLKEMMPYPLTRVEDEVSQLKVAMPILDDFFEERYYIIRGSVVAVSLDVAFHRAEGLVNFSFLLQPRELFKKTTAMNVFRNHVIPYVQRHTGKNDWIEISPGQYILEDRIRSLCLMAKFLFTHPMKSFGFAVIDLKYA